MTPEATISKKIRDPLRVLWFRLLSLQYYTRLKVVMDLNLIRDEDMALGKEELFNRVFQRAAEEKRLPELWDRVEQEYSDGKYPYNPYREHGGTYK
jgi:hypothetical protein